MRGNRISHVRDMMGGGQGPCGVTRGSQGDRISPARDTGGTGSVPAGPGTAVRRNPPPHLPSPILQPAMCVPLQSAHRACTPQNSVAGRKTLISLQKSKNQPQESHRIPELGTALHRVGLGTLSPPPPVHHGRHQRCHRRCHQGSGTAAGQTIRSQEVLAGVIHKLGAGARLWGKRWVRGSKGQILAPGSPAACRDPPHFRAVG